MSDSEKIAESENPVPSRVQGVSEAEPSWLPANTSPRDGTVVLILGDDNRRSLAYWQQTFDWKKLRTVSAFHQLYFLDPGEELSGTVVGWYPLPEQQEIKLSEDASQ